MSEKTAEKTRKKIKLGKWTNFWNGEREEVVYESWPSSDNFEQCEKERHPVLVYSVTHYRLKKKQTNETVNSEKIE